MAQLSGVLNGLNLVGFAKTMDEIPKRYWIIRAGGPVSAEFHSYKYDLPIRYPNIGSIVHRQVIQSTVDGSTAKGDSGAPVVVGKHGGRFLGMHIAGAGSTSIMIPAWQLMTSRLYQLAAKESWEIL